MKDKGVGLHECDMGVLVMGDRNASVAHAVYRGSNGERLEGVGSSKRESGDVHDPVIGHRLATARALVALAHDLAKSTGYELKGLS